MSKNNVVLAVLCVIGIATFVGMAFLTRTQYTEAYASATAHIKEGKYEAALQELSIVGEGYRDSTEMMEMCHKYITYKEGVVAMEAGHWKTALDRFATIRDFKDVREKLQQCKEKYIDELVGMSHAELRVYLQQQIDVGDHDA